MKGKPNTIRPSHQVGSLWSIDEGQNRVPLQNHGYLKLFIQELEPAFNVNVGSEKLMLYNLLSISFKLKCPLQRGIDLCAWTRSFPEFVDFVECVQ